jgi:hypothetical protein
MRLLVPLFAGLSLSTVAQAQSLQISGTCPTGVDIQITDLTPGGTYAILRANGTGNATVPAGPCAGTPTGLDASQGLVTSRTATASGNVTFNDLQVGPSVCGRTISVLDVGTCAASNVDTVPDAVPPTGLTTTFTGSMNLPAGSVMYLDIEAATDLSLTGFEVHLRNGRPNASVRIWQRSGTWLGNEDSPLGWTQVATGTIPTPRPAGQRSTVVLAQPLPVSAGRHGLMFEYVGDGQEFTDGLFPIGDREAGSDAFLTIYEGGAGNAPFTGLCCAPRVWNGTIFYRP